ncbi:MAG TPA: hypothetical protein VFA69_05785 [Candidatus Nitrosotalea sp.]|nr:hypothetical protein [Candidatus Nitrosotalea sp.]
MFARQIRSNDHSHSWLDALLFVAEINHKCIGVMIEMRNIPKYRIRMQREIKLSLDISIEALEEVELILKRFEHENYLSPDTMCQYRETVSRIRDDVSIARSLLGE